ncbi:hypothetical protein P154DRAFT_624574 [Amniculicola lignicola CBS 123094]|uniref:Uncharacterized protein n=1 Tax=Amniculicola lignicola CBS 123094 TaxID=1392246 RepID=A0A6A5W0R8_9PLEO|nr:hypothetical protein P154DRAFT_624574 [Amniculicola lignicola CBS 123094]
MTSLSAIEKMEQARALIEEARGLAEDKSIADAKELQELREKLSAKDTELSQKEKELKRKERDLRLIQKELKSRTEALEHSTQPVRIFIHDEYRKSYHAVAQAQQAHSQAPSRYTAGFVELAKGNHDENEERFKRLAAAVGIDYSSLELTAAFDADGKFPSVPPTPEKKNPKESFHSSRYLDRQQLVRRDSGVA